MRVYGVALSASEASAIYNQGAGDLVAFYPRQVAYVGVPFSLQVVATQGPESYSAGSILGTKGLSIHSATGVISGTPNAVGDFNSNVTVTNSSGSQTLLFLLRVLKGSRTLDWNQTIAGLTYGDSAFSLSANPTGTGDLFFGSSDSSIIEINGTTKTIHQLDDNLVHYWKFDETSGTSASPTRGAHLVL